MPPLKAAFFIKKFEGSKLVKYFAILWRYEKPHNILEEATFIYVYLTTKEYQSNFLQLLSFRGENQTTVPHLGGARFDDHNGVIIIKAMPQASDLKMTSYLQTYHPIC